MIKSFEDIQAIGKDSVDAYVASATALSKGFQTITAEAVDFSRKSFERGTEAFEKASSAKSFDKALEVQHCQEMNVGRIVPLIRKQIGFRGATAP